ncbi:unnamed protein product [Thelazia callipaeda]|uniref:Uncharacterized protein n=1 Tax=Thelazia callipaeda TaxID=103827 RepID=A0A0N5D095_THECL|nr:unnamed protein product [Thelazia callipaeda]
MPGKQERKEKERNDAGNNSAEGTQHSREAESAVGTEATVLEHFRGRGRGGNRQPAFFGPFAEFTTPPPATFDIPPRVLPARMFNANVVPLRDRDSHFNMQFAPFLNRCQPNQNDNSHPHQHALAGSSNDSATSYPSSSQLPAFNYNRSDHRTFYWNSTRQEIPLERLSVLSLGSIGMVENNCIARPSCRTISFQLVELYHKAGKQDKRKKTASSSIYENNGKTDKSRWPGEMLKAPFEKMLRKWWPLPPIWREARDCN